AFHVTGVQTCALPISGPAAGPGRVLAVPAPGHAAVGRARARPGQTRAVGPHESGRLAGPDGRRPPGAARAVLRPDARAGADVLRSGERRVGKEYAGRW